MWKLTKAPALVRAASLPQLYAKLKRVGDCLEWQGSVAANGYGKWRQTTAHKVSYYLHNGVYPSPKMHVMHTCDNRRCCRPEHLVLGTCKDNFDDAEAKGRRLIGEQRWNNKLSPQDARDILKRLAKGETQSAIARDYGVSQKLISNINLRKMRYSK